MSSPRASRWHLERVSIGSFGKLRDVAVGPFAPGMNVVFGKNESGKTTLSSFVQGVLFGWPDGRSRRNTYKPEDAERSGRLLFRANDGAEAALARVRNADGVEDAHGLLGDIDAATYQTVFALDSDELLSLDDAAGVTARLLTAGSGAATSPAQALREIDGRIARFHSRAASAGDSLANLAARLQAVEQEVSRADAEAAEFIAQRAEYEAIAPRREAIAREWDRLNALIEGRTADLTLLQSLEGQLADLQGQRLAADAQLADAQAQAARSGRDAAAWAGEAAASGGTASATAGADGAFAAAGSSSGAGAGAVSVEGAADAAADAAALRGLSPAEERTIRDTLDDFQEERDRLMAAVDHAKRDLANSQAAYETLQEQLESGADRPSRSRTVGQAVLSVVLPAIAILAGAPTTVYGYSIGSLTITAFGIFLVLAGLVMGAAAIVVAARPGQTGSPLAQRVEDARWVMLQDRKKLEAAQAELSAMGERIAAYFHFNHLAQAGRSLRRARRLLDDARDARVATAAHERQIALLRDRVADLDQGIAQVQARCDELLADADVADSAAFEALVATAIGRRQELQAEAERMDTRSGELAQRLSLARGDASFAQLKQERAALCCRIAESRFEYACLLVARRNLAQAIEQWESGSQPAVYRLASRLFSDMTGGAWTQVRLTADGAVQVADRDGGVRDPQLLSLGTRQQLYLALRISLLLTAGNVGRAVPVLADDILVNFDSERRRSAAAALLELAQMRQVILFTCHEEVLDLVCGLAPDTNVVRLS